MNVPSKSERDDGGSNDIGWYGFAFAVCIWIIAIYVFFDSVV